VSEGELAAEATKSQQPAADGDQKPNGPKRLSKMEANPKNDWKIRDIEQVCNQMGLQFEPPNSGSHYKVLSEYVEGALTVPAARPIKAVYIKSFVALCRAHLAYSAKAQEISDEG